jgi:hypothetical protein
MLHYEKELKTASQSLRKTATDAEKHLWSISPIPSFAKRGNEFFVTAQRKKELRMGFIKRFALAVLSLSIITVPAG